MNSATRIEEPDVCIASFADVHGWGGGIAAANGLAEACRRRGLRSLTLGVSRSGGAVAGPPSEAERINVQLVARPGSWRIQSWRVVGVLKRFLRQMAPPRVAFIGNSMYWVVAAKRVWPQLRVAYRWPCLLTNCLPFTWPAPKRPTFWQRVNLAGVSRAEMAALRLADLTLVATRANVEELAAFCPAARERIVQSDFGCREFELNDTARIRQRRALAVDDCTFLVTAIGVCDRNKGFDLAIRALASCDPRIVLLIVGDGPQRPECERLARRLNLGARVRFVGAQREMAPWYAATDAVLSTSFYDAYPNVIREAMWAGRPVIVPEHDPPHVYTGIAEVVRDAAAGIVYDRRRPETLVEAIDALARGGRAARCGAAGQELARRAFCWDACLDRIVGRAPQPATASLPAAAAASGCNVRTGGSHLAGVSPR